MAELRELQSRVQELELRLYGKSGAHTRKVTDGLIKVQGGLGNIASKRERVKTLYKKKEPYILSQAALLEQLHSLQPLLDSEHIKAVPALASKLQTLSQIHIKQQDQSEEVTAETKRLLEDYNKMTLLLSKQFVMWDEVLSQVEAAQQVKPRSE
ncbi:dynactin subunit 3 isoform X2 [Phyllobates terribilis]|uniref:dynactin subunit 3 isoform X2 n=1 Tax=Phyllobates terribilis TaxID=111132 RepID=UPI003CCAFE0E